MPDSGNNNLTHAADVARHVEVTYEASDVHIAGIAKFGIGLAILTIAVYFMMWGLFRVFESSEKEPSRSPMALRQGEQLPPEPRLQGAPGFGAELERTAPGKTEAANPQTAGGGLENPKDSLWEIRALRSQWQDILEHGPVDQNGQRYGMPIEEAKKKILEQGLPVRKQ
jgi:hypothetical protein